MLAAFAGFPLSLYIGFPLPPVSPTAITVDIFSCYPANIAFL